MMARPLSLDLRERIVAAVPAARKPYALAPHEKQVRVCAPQPAVIIASQDHLGMGGAGT
jgi:hypothetical protein